MNEVNIEKRKNVERFEVAFNQIHTKLKELSHNEPNHNFMNLLHKIRERHTTIRYHFQELKQYAKLRNALVHEKVREGFYIAEPHLDVITKLENINRALHQPPYATAIASKNVLYFEEESQVKDVLRAIKRYGFSQVPVYVGREFKGLLTEGGLLRWFTEHMTDEYVPVGEVTVNEVLYVEDHHNVAFIAKDKTIYDVEDLFGEYFDRNEKLEAILITETGSRNEKPLGIITTWDLVQIDRTAVTLMG
ncbi:MULTISPECIES: CBS domain-containing protein [Pontibacillus]|uniref:CBS domain-containing protein n=1 Tax=Pontibacillus chungwhensis TaxID=265426 RepID=A0ABY8UWV3_9BACI|nr:MULTISPECIES: CBS domain-containing protein [Pontibacillus]MCD5324163.1 CBS domain-containing protein [Pontibacillus sp. HN14]WIF97778.1 CBS domain-containing protein [Pontibacillus chungwhensis]